MKRLIKLLSIFGVLIILGSCSSSKSVNVSTVLGEVQYIKFTSLDETNYPLKYIYITGGEYNNKLFFPDRQISVDTGYKYTIVWTVLDKSDGKYYDYSKSNIEFNFNDGTTIYGLGNSSSLFIPQEN